MTYSNTENLKYHFVKAMSIGREYSDLRANIAQHIYDSVFVSDIKLSDENKLFFSVSLQYLLEHFLIRQKNKNFGSKKTASMSAHTGKDHSDKVHIYLKKIQRAGNVFQSESQARLDPYWQSKMNQLVNEVENLTLNTLYAYQVFLDEKAHIKKHLDKIVFGLQFINGKNRNTIIKNVLAALGSDIQVKVINQQLRRWSQKIILNPDKMPKGRSLLQIRKLLYYSVLDSFTDMRVLSELVGKQEATNFDSK